MLIPLWVDEGMELFSVIKNHPVSSGQCSLVGWSIIPQPKSCRFNPRSGTYVPQE